MADDPRNDAPLAAPIAEQLEAKDRLDEQAEAERQAAESQRLAVERRKAVEQATVAAHLAEAGVGGPGAWHERRERARERGRRFARALDVSGGALPATGAALALLGLVTRRRGLLGLGLPLLAGALLWRRPARAPTPA